MICPRLGIAFFDIPKGASTSIKLSIHELENGQPFEPPKLIHDAYPARRYSEESWESSNGMYRFAVVRDPVKRLLSTWSNRVEFYKEVDVAYRKKSALKKAFFRLRGGKPEPTVEQFVSRLDLYQRTSPSIRHHSRSIDFFLGPSLDRYDAVYRVEDISLLEKHLSERIGQDVQFPRVQTGGAKIAFGDLSASEKAGLQKATAQEYAYLGKYYTAPWAT